MTYEFAELPKAWPYNLSLEVIFCTELRTEERAFRCFCGELDPLNRLCALVEDIQRKHPELIPLRAKQLDGRHDGLKIGPHQTIEVEHPDPEYRKWKAKQNE